MKKLFLNIILLLVCQQIYACTFDKESFCWTLQVFPERNILVGQIVEQDTTGITVALLEVIRGEEERDTIRIWDGTDFECNGPWSMAAIDIGEIGDTFILMMPKIVDVENDWDVVGDYRRGNPYSYTPELRVEGALAMGFIKGIPGAPPSVNILEYDYASLRIELANAGDCSGIVPSRELIKQDLRAKVINPISSYMTVHFSGESQCNYLRLYSQDGQLVLQEKLERGAQVFQVTLSTLPSGLYLLRMEYDDGLEEFKKIVKI
jgi:hypothetical protein